jgi:hypothetical protein
MAGNYLSPWNVMNISDTEYGTPYSLCENSSLFKQESLSSINDGYPTNVIFMERPEDMLKPWIINPMFFNIIITHSIAFIVGLVGNIVVVMVMVGDRKSRSATNLFLVSLAVADLLLLLVYAPLETLQYFVMQWDESAVVCKTAMYALLLSAVVSVLNLVAVTLERSVRIPDDMRSSPFCDCRVRERSVAALHSDVYGGKG